MGFHLNVSPEIANQLATIVLAVVTASWKRK